MNERKFTVLVIGLIVVIASILMCVFSMFILMNYGDTDKYDVSRDYTVEGTIVVDAIEYQCTGEGKSVPVKETGNDHLYRFTFDYSYSGTSKSLTFDLFCDSSGNPLTNLYDKSTDPEGNTVWSYTDGGITYRFYVEEYCKVPSVTITGDGLSLKAAVKE